MCLITGYILLQKCSIGLLYIFDLGDIVLAPSTYICDFPVIVALLFVSIRLAAHCAVPFVPLARGGLRGTSRDMKLWSRYVLHVLDTDLEVHIKYR